MKIEKMTAAQIADVTLEQFNRLSTEEAREALAKVRRSVNQRIRRLEKSGVPSPALEGFQKGGERLKSSGGLSRNETLAEIKRGIDFLNAKTSTVTGARRVRKKALEDIGLPTDTSDAEATSAYNMFNKLKEEFPAVLNAATAGDKYLAYKKRIGQMIRRGNTYEEIREEMQSIYEEIQTQYQADEQDIRDGFL